MYNPAVLEELQKNCVARAFAVVTRYRSTLSQKDLTHSFRRKGAKEMKGKGRE